MLSVRSIYSVAFALLLALPAHANYSRNASSRALKGETPTIETGQLPTQLQDAGIKDTQLGSKVSIDELKFRNEAGQTVALSEYFKKGRPVVLNLVYFDCPNLCNLLLNGFLDTLKTMSWTPGREFEVLTISIEPKEGAELAAAKKKAHIEALGKPDAAQGWHFLTGTQENITRLTQEVGFGYKWDPVEKQWAHGAGLFLLSPEGKLSRILYGIAWGERELKLALLEASQGKVGTILDRVIMFCYSYNPHTRKYSLIVVRVMQVAAIATTLMLGSFIALSVRRQRKGEPTPC